MQCDCTRRRPSLRLPSSAWTPAAGAACWCARVTPAPTHPVPSHRLSGRRACAKVQLLSNRARAYLELCMPLAAMEDAQQCLQLDPSFVKAYHRLAAAHTALGRCGAYPTHTPPLAPTSRRGNTFGDFPLPLGTPAPPRPVPPPLGAPPPPLPRHPLITCVPLSRCRAVAHAQG